MPNCIICHDHVTSGFVLCSRCKEKLEPFALPPDLAYFIDQLAEDLVLDKNIHSCDLCAIGNCTSQVGGLTCRNGVKAWLLTRAGNYFAKEKCA